MRTTTPFDPKRHHIHLEAQVQSERGIPWNFDGLLDTGAPWTEFSDLFLIRVGLLDQVPSVSIQSGLQTQKYGKLILPELKVCGQTLTDFEIRVSRFEQSWGIDALVGLDFFRRFQVTIDYDRAVLEVG